MAYKLTKYTSIFAYNTCEENPYIFKSLGRTPNDLELEKMKEWNKTHQKQYFLKGHWTAHSIKNLLVRYGKKRANCTYKKSWDKGGQHIATENQSPFNVTIDRLIA